MTTNAEVTAKRGYIPKWPRSDERRRTFRIVYLEGSKRILTNEAIDIAILSGKHAGFHDSFDAGPGGAWLGIPIGAALFGFGFFGLNYTAKT